MTLAVAVAHPNIALAKYWGKRDKGRNVPSVPSLSVTLAGMSTTTRVELAERDSLVLNGRESDGRPAERAFALLELLWLEAGKSGARPRASVSSRNDFPTAAGLASSASAFAALAVAADRALATALPTERLSSLARRISASSGRSLYGGFVELAAGEPESEFLPARPVAPADYWDLRLVVAVTSEGAKDVGSTEGMNLTTETSPLYGGWLAAAPAIFERIKRAVLDRDIEALGPAVEASALTMHATALSACPGILYWNGTTVDVMHAVRRMRQGGLPAYVTMDAGPHVKVVTLASHAEQVALALRAIPGVLRTIMAQPGGGAHVLEGPQSEPTP